MDLAHFIAALQRVDATGGPLPGAHNSWRGEPLTERDAAARTAITILHNTFNYEAAEWAGLVRQSRAPKRHGRKVCKKLERGIQQVRSELDAEAASRNGWKYLSLVVSFACI